MNSLRIGWSVLIVVSSVTLLIGFADAQLPRQEHANINLMAKTPLGPSKLDGWITPGQRTMEMVALQPPPPAYKPTVLPPVVIPAHGMGGNLDEHKILFASYRHTAYQSNSAGRAIRPARCSRPMSARISCALGRAGSWRSMPCARCETRARSCRTKPRHVSISSRREIRRWIDRNGGHENLPLDGFWTMYDRDLWAMGYPKCK